MVEKRDFSMARTTMLRAQIDVAEAMLDRILIAIDGYGGASSAYPLSLDLSRLAGVMRIHFSLGDRHLYPFMIASYQRETAEIACRFQRENNQLTRRFERFMQRWSTSDAIASDMARFRCDAEAMMTAIRDQFRRETRDLFPLADALGERRDPDVHIDAMDAFAAAVGAQQRRGVQTLTNRLRERQAAGNEILASALQGAEHSDLAGRLQALAQTALKPEPESEPAESEPVQEPEPEA